MQKLTFIIHVEEADHEPSIFSIYIFTVTNQQSLYGKITRGYFSNE